MYSDKVRISKGFLSIEIVGPNAKLVIGAICFVLICIGLAIIASKTSNVIRYIG